ncbi:helix-turn-helix transcriptional regulator [Nocardia sp. NEAU-G5]|uniref:Helix-turn-helix transcriptional regulator n=1 Tax=Nocardia albiluteola TaxID=2842303 RepID=A0ABS6B3X8_9NOCA|nr:helix-turn-helix transcriptional regulator [Nocardia albiluteola]MBU3063914.1 helix-turn-helix transcriptional regulator [Nocardia albiluteola]
MDMLELGSALRGWRDRIAPAAAGVPVGGRRRAAGLRREELAQLAGISIDYLTRLEQGRATTPSEQVVESLARALRLTGPEREHMFRLAGRVPPGPGVVPTRITPSVQRLLDRFAYTPVVVYDAAWNLIVANAPYDALMGQTTHWTGIERNAVWRNLFGAGNRTVRTPAEQAEFVSALVADLRMTVARYPDDSRLRRLVVELTAAGPKFTELWESGAVPPPQQEHSLHKTIAHPDVGPITLDCDVLIVAGSDLRIMVYTAEPGSEDADRLAIAAVLGTQTLTE